MKERYVIGVMPSFLDNREIAHKNLSELIMVDSMHERKAIMAKLTDGYIALPGGPGTLEQFFEVFRWGQLGLHKKPCGLLNIDNYFDLLINFLSQMNKQEFLQEKYITMLINDTELASLIEQFQTYNPPSVKTYIKASQT